MSTLTQQLPTSRTLPVFPVGILALLFGLLAWFSYQQHKATTGEEFNDQLLPLGIHLMQAELKGRSMMPGDLTSLPKATQDKLVDLVQSFRQARHIALLVADANGRVLLDSAGLTGESSVRLPYPKLLEEISSGMVKGDVARYYSYSSDGMSNYAVLQALPDSGLILVAHGSTDSPLSEIGAPYYLIVLGGLVAMGFVWYTGISSQKRLQRQHMAQIVTDPLTNLPNRRGFDLLAHQGVSEAVRTNQALSIILIGIDRFSNINDNYGHASGDTVLKRVSATLRTSLRGSDVLCRWGGDEFIVMLKNTPADRACLVAEKLRKLVSDQTFSFSGEQVHLSVSAGVSGLIPKESLRSMLARSNHALHQAKDKGRNQTHMA
ncbi:GGDEF domain-containing protein [Pokkaliibacter sp. CJK22405]|uniref:GGDEF domain-containing protein n=1 Tax=Pokkaliibacter sp. CJK22405 TaxID=3384615 RepID=UPI003984A0B8